MTAYQPFLIGQQKTGLFQYLQPWMAPEDAWTELENAFVYRGQLTKRNGISQFDCTIPIGPITIATGSGAKSYSGTLLSYPVVPGTLSIAAAGNDTFSDGGEGVLAGSNGGFGAINYLTGAWSVSFSSVVPSGAITAAYSVSNSHLEYQDSIATGDGVTTTFGGTLATHPILGGTFNPTDGVETFTDNGDGTLIGSLTGSGTIVYSTGVWSITFNTAPLNHAVIKATFSPQIVDGTRPIMGLKQWTNETNGVGDLIALDTRRASAFDDTTGCFEPIETMSQVLWVDDGSSTSITLPTSWAAVSPYTQIFTPFTVTISYTGNTMTDLGNTHFPGVGDMLNTTTVNYQTGVVLLNLSANTKGRTFTITATLTGDYFTGGLSNFFNSTNWLGDLYLTNNVDPITLYDGTNLFRPAFSIDIADQLLGVQNIGTALDVEVYKNRFLVIRPTYINTVDQNGVQGQTIAYSAINKATNLVADVPGNGGFIEAATDDFIQSSEFLRDQLIIFFANTVWSFRFTGSSFDPFRFDKLNNTKATTAPYGTIAYDERITAMGNRGLIACDGVNVQRYDLQIIDQYLQIDQKNFKQCYATRFDSINQSWMLFPSKAGTDVVLDTKLSDKAIVYNFLENTWAVFDIKMMCLGIYHQVIDKVWSQYPAPPPPIPDQPPFLLNSWGSSNFAWAANVLQNQTPIILGGGQDGQVYLLDDSESYTDNGVAITSSTVSAQWNPFISKGQRIQFGWIDFYYSILPSEPGEEQPDPPILTLEFYLDNSTAPINNPATPGYKPQRLTLDGPEQATSAMKRIYVNAIGEFLQMEITSDSPAPFNILGLTIWARPAGRITP